MHYKYKLEYMKTSINRKQPYYIVYASETIVYSDDNVRLVACPTEQEAIEYIEDLE